MAVSKKKATKATPAKKTAAKGKKTPAKGKARKFVTVSVHAKFVEDVVAEVAGRDVVPLVRALKQRSNVSEFTLAEAIKCEINATRNMLYRLQENNLVTFTRKKDKKKGWYIYYWTFNSPRVKELLMNLKKAKLDKLQERLNREKATQFYVCYQQERLEDGTTKRGAISMRLDFDTAVSYGFRCPESGQLLELEDNADRIRQLEQEIETIKKEIADLT